MRHFLLFAPLLLAVPSRAAVKAAQVQVTLTPEKTSMMLGEPNFLRFTVRNLSGQNWKVQVGGDYRNVLGRPNSFKVKATGASGKPVPQPSVEFEMGGITGPQKIPAHGSYTFSLFVPHWAAFSRTGKYRFEASKTLMLSIDTPGSAHDFDWESKSVAVPASAACELTVVPRDAAKMGQVIADLGKIMLGSDADKSEGAAHTLAYIQDERVVPLFVRAVGTDSYDLKLTALSALSKFRSDAALEGIKLGMATRTEDMGSTDRADNVRSAAAFALSKSPNPRARAFLIAQRHDSSVGVRITVVQAVGERPSAGSLPILREMASDENTMVVHEAKRYIKLLSARR